MPSKRKSLKCTTLWCRALMITRKTRLGHDTDMIISDSLDRSLSVKKGEFGTVYKTGVFGGRWGADRGNPDFLGHLGTRSVG